MAYSYIDADLFPSIQDDKNIYIFYRFIEKLSVHSITIEFYISIVGIISTIFHLTVLFKILGSSIVSLMIATAICDLLSMIVNIATRDMILNFQGGECTPPNSLLVNHIFWILMTIRDDVIRCSTWLAVLMALIRFLVSKYFSKSQFQKISSFKFGTQISVASFIFSTILSACFYLCVQFVVIGTWRSAIT
uniref:7TM_GPCR_Srx domain-containing protein n=2 Tax=Caenorhabditis tropicalis TaxID=1561998 RepID=A0A1I7UJ99_9PELO